MEKGNCDEDKDTEGNYAIVTSPAGFLMKLKLTPPQPVAIKEEPMEQPGGSEQRNEVFTEGTTSLFAEPLLSKSPTPKGSQAVCPTTPKSTPRRSRRKRKLLDKFEACVEESLQRSEVINQKSPRVNKKRKVKVEVDDTPESETKPNIDTVRKPKRGRSKGSTKSTPKTPSKPRTKRPKKATTVNLPPTPEEDSADAEGLFTEVSATTHVYERMQIMPSSNLESASESQDPQSLPDSFEVLVQFQTVYETTSIISSPNNFDMDNLPVAMACLALSRAELLQEPFQNITSDPKPLQLESVTWSSYQDEVPLTPMEISEENLDSESPPLIEVPSASHPNQTLDPTPIQIESVTWSPYDDGVPPVLKEIPLPVLDDCLPPCNEVPSASQNNLMASLLNFDLTEDFTDEDWNAIINENWEYCLRIFDRNPFEKLSAIETKNQPPPLPCTSQEDKTYMKCMPPTPGPVQEEGEVIQTESLQVEVEPVMWGAQFVKCTFCDKRFSHCMAARIHSVACNELAIPIAKSA